MLIELVKQLIKSAVGFSSFPILVATGDELPKPIYKALLRAMPLGPVLRRRHQRWAGSILRKLIAYRDGRNAALMRATFDFRSIIAHGLIAEADQMICELPRFPCSLSKRPLTARGHLAATTSPIDESCWPLTGVPTGTASGLDVLDVDAAGLVWLDQNYSRLPPTRVHESRSGGRHLLFNHALGLRCNAGRVATGVDVRADGGYVIWWPRAGLRVLSDAPVADWPGWLLELARPPSGAPPRCK